MAIFNIVPRVDQQGKLGLENKRWEEINAVSGSFSETKTDSLKTTAGNDLLVEGSNVTITQDPSTSQYTISSTGGSTNVVSASTITEGIIRISTASEFSTGTSTLTAVTPAQISQVFNEISTLSGSISGSLANINNNPAVGAEGVIQISDGSSSLAESQWTIKQTGTNLGSIVPSTNDTLDIGEPEYKVRDLYLGQNSIKFVKDGFIDLTQTPPFSLGLTDNDELSINGSTLSSVAFTGDYNDLLNLPVIPDITGGITYKGQINLVDETVTINGTPSLISSISFTQGDLFAVSVAGNLSSVSFDVNDHVIFNQDVLGSAITDSVFDKIDNTDIDTQVAAATTLSTGSVTLATLSGLVNGSDKVVTGDLFKLENLSDVVFDRSTIINNMVLRYDQQNENFRFTTDLKGVDGINSFIDIANDNKGVLEIMNTYDIIPAADNITSSLGSTDNPWNQIHSDTVTTPNLVLNATESVIISEHSSSINASCKVFNIEQIAQASLSNDYVSSRLSFNANIFNTTTNESQQSGGKFFISTHDLGAKSVSINLTSQSANTLTEASEIDKERDGLLSLACGEAFTDNDGVFQQNLDWIKDDNVVVISDLTSEFVLNKSFNTGKTNTLVHAGLNGLTVTLSEGSFIGQTIIVKSLSAKGVTITTDANTLLDGLSISDPTTLVPLGIDVHDALTFKLIEIDSNGNCSWIII